MTQQSKNNRIVSLETKHKQLDNDLNRLYKHSSVSSSTVNALKKRKLEIKDQITKLKERERNG